ncbi:hypothetical protein [Paenibacillus planticolens]|uniref:Uncharacterized protein n=1 Tax=Paenibacillus planticolens TaxID=2654976 RepID=A0ABX1ZKS6_9BACL|nr:hypothetical protein [Paenibacillus planticolens]NOV00661.1 hypothetical protein [Paenibacillus planticolens]
MDRVNLLSIGEPFKENQYYKGFQFTIKTVINGVVHFIGDGGFVDWTQKIIGNKKERLLISAIGLDRLLLLEQPLNSHEN